MPMDLGKMPMDLGKLKDLQVLSSFNVDKCSDCNIKTLGELNLHGTLSISELQNIVNPSDALTANLKNKAYLVTLELTWSEKNDSSEKEREVLENLQPSKHLKKLFIFNYGGTRFPAILKNLQIRSLSGIVVIGSEFYGNGSISSSVIIPFASLQTLIFDDMEGWEEWNCQHLSGAFPCLQELFIRNCLNLKECLPKQLPCLMKLQISYSKQLSGSVPLAPAIHELHLIDCGKLHFDYHPSTLRILKIQGHMEELFLELIGHILSHTYLESSEISYCPTMNIPVGCCYNFLISLNICGSFDSLWTFPLDFFPKLQTLKLVCCNNFETISQEHDNDHSLTSLEIGDCPKFVSFPKGGFSAPSLKSFRIARLKNLKSLPECMHTLFSSLTDLTIRSCPQLESFSDGGLPSSLKHLWLYKCSELLIASLKWALGINTSLFYLYIEKVNVESFPDQGLLPISLTSLHVSGCLNLKNLEHKVLCHLSSLKSLELIDCLVLQCLPVEGLPISISTLEIRRCPLLKQQCKKPGGEDWGKISHIQNVSIDFYKIN